jgi:hypothetical protein
MIVAWRSSLWVPIALLLFTWNMAAAQPLDGDGRRQPSENERENRSCILQAATNGQMITVRGQARSTAHDLVFDVLGCSETVLLIFAGDEDSGVNGSELHQDSNLRRFRKYTSTVYKSRGANICMECAEYGDVKAELRGKLEIATLPAGSTKDKANFIRDDSGKLTGKFGWGHPTPYAAYRLVIQSVTGVSAKKLPRP